MRVYKRGKIWWIEFRHLGQHIRESSHSEHRPVALRFLRRRVAESEAGQGAPGRLKFTGLIQLVREDYQINDRRSADSLEFRIRYLEAAFGACSVKDVTADRIERYKAERLQAGAAKGTVNLELAALSKMFSLAISRDLLHRRPTIKRFDVSDNARQGFVSKAQYEALRAHLPEWLLDAADWMFLTGMRTGAVKRLERRDYDGEFIRVRPEISKNKEGIDIPLVGPLRVAIERALAKKRIDCPLIFHRDGKPLMKDLWRPFRVACAAAGLPVIIPHDLRRSAVKNMIDAGIDEQVAMTISGHKDRAVFRRYRIVNHENRRRALERLAEYLAEQPAKTIVVPIARTKAAR